MCQNLVMIHWVTSAIDAAKKQTKITKTELPNQY